MPGKCPRGQESCLSRLKASSLAAGLHLTGPIKLLSLGIGCRLGVHHCQNLRRRLADSIELLQVLYVFFFDEDMQLLVFLFPFVTVFSPFLEDHSTSCTTASSLCLSSPEFHSSPPFVSEFRSC